MEHFVVLQEGGFTEGTDEESGEPTTTFHVSSHVEIPVKGDQHQWELWASMCEGFDSSPHWDVISTNEGYRSYQHRDLRSRVIRVYLWTN